MEITIREKNPGPQIHAVKNGSVILASGKPQTEEQIALAQGKPLSKKKIIK